MADRQLPDDAAPAPAGEEAEPAAGELGGEAVEEAPAGASSGLPEELAADGGDDDDEAGLQLTQELDELCARAERADEYLALAQRTQADFENYRKRAARETANAQQRGIARLAKELLPAIDNLGRALDAASEEESQLAHGIRLVHADLLAALARVGVEPFSPAGEPFDPQLHEAVAQQPVEGVAAGAVAEVFQQGFRLGDSVLRPARVLVAA